MDLLDQGVERPHLVAPRQQGLGHMAADKARPAGNQNSASHTHLPFFRCRLMVERRCAQISCRDYLQPLNDQILNCKFGR